MTEQQPTLTKHQELHAHSLGRILKAIGNIDTTNPHDVKTEALKIVQKEILNYPIGIS